MKFKPLFSATNGVVCVTSGLLGYLDSFFVGCQANDGDQQANEALVEDNLPADFVSFYEEFHRDSSFQMDRIIWPLEGVPDNAGDRLTDRTFRWQRNEWRIMQPTDVQSSFQREFLPLSNELIIEKITNNTYDWGKGRAVCPHPPLGRHQRRLAPHLLRRDESGKAG